MYVWCVGKTATGKSATVPDLPGCRFDIYIPVALLPVDIVKFATIHTYMYTIDTKLNFQTNSQSSYVRNISYYWKMFIKTMISFHDLRNTFMT